MKKARKFLSLALCAVLLVTATVAGTLAYLTAKTDTVKNTFTVGNVNFDAEGGLDEAKVDEYGKEVTPAERVKANTYKLVPGHSYKKDPTVHLAANNEACYVFVKVGNGISDIEAAGDTTIAAQITAKGWTEYGTNTGIYYKTADATGKDGADLVVFESFTLADNADVSTYGSAEITIRACLVQQDGVDLATAYSEAVTLLNSAESTTQP